MHGWLPIRLRLTATYVVLLVGALTVVLALSWSLLAQHLRRTLPEVYADAVLSRLSGQYALAVAGVGLAALGVGWLVAGRALAPLRAIATTARGISDQRLDARVRLDGPDDEIRQLASAFDAMLDRVAGAVDAQRRFVANASHELRTPLTVMRAEAEVALDDPAATAADLREVARVVVAATERTEALLDGLLVLASSARGVRRDEAVALDAVVRRAVAALHDEASAAGIVVDVQATAVAVRGDEALLERLVANLVENAIRHGRLGGPVRLELTTNHGAAQLRVISAGDVVPPDALARLAEPFERLHRGRGRGSGLGLSVVRAVAEAHGGTLELHAPREGGLDVVVRLASAVTPR